MQHSLDPCDPEAGCAVCPLFESDPEVYAKQDNASKGATIQYNQPTAPLIPVTVANYFGVDQGWTELNPSYNDPNASSPSNNVAFFSPPDTALPLERDPALSTTTFGNFLSQGAPFLLPDHGDVVSLETFVPSSALSPPLDWNPSYHGDSTLFDGHDHFGESISFQSQARPVWNPVPPRLLEQSRPCITSSYSLKPSFAAPLRSGSATASRAGTLSSTKITKRTGHGRQYGRSAESCVLCQRPNSKKRCSSEPPCRPCLDAAHRNYALAKRLCYRDKQSVLDVRLSISDFFDVKSSFTDLVFSFSYRSGTCAVKWFHPKVINESADPRSVLSTFPFVPMLKEHLNLPKLLTRRGASIANALAKASTKFIVHRTTSSGIGIYGESHIPNMGLPIKDQSILSMKDLFEWASRIIGIKALICPEDVESILDSLLLTWCRDADTNPQEFDLIVKRILVISILGRYLDGRVLINYDYSESQSKALGTLEPSMFTLTRDAHSRLLNLIAEKTEELERQVLVQIDALVPSNRKHASKSLVVGLCIRRLSLYYRRIMLYCKGFAKHETCRKNAQEMYDMMIRKYCGVFQDQLTPFHHRWKMTDHVAALRDNKDLITLFDQFKDAEAVHYKRDVNKEDDIVYVAMFAEKKNKQHKAPAHFLDEHGLLDRLGLIEDKAYQRWVKQSRVEY